MVILGNWNGKSITISVKSNCLTVSITSKSASEVYSYDYEGRLWTAMVAGVSYRRGLDGKIVAKWIDATGQRQRRWMAVSEATILIESARVNIINLYAAILHRQADISPTLDPLGIYGFEKAIEFTSQRSGQDSQEYFKVYQPIGILPPDQYMAVVLQMTEGCSFNTCSFCTFYRDRPFRIKSPREFADHIGQVKSFLGKGLSLRRTIFLADANALVTPTARLLSLLDVVNYEMDVAALGGMYAFLDGFSGEKRDKNGYAQLYNKGLRRIYIGLESGNLELLKFLNKPGTPNDVISAVNNIKAAGISVGIIVLLGAGGHQFHRQHVDDTIRAINAMPLNLDDLIYFSELVENEGMAYVQDAYQANLKPLTGDERIQQGEEIERGLQFSAKGGTPHISRYDIREFVY
jgi:hypothetical protein